MKKTRMLSLVALAIVCSFIATLMLGLPVAAITAEELFATFEKDAVEQQEMENLKSQILLEDELNRWAQERREARENAGKPKTYTQDQEIKDLSTAIKITGEHFSTLLRISNDMIDGGDFSVATCINGIMDLAGDIAAACGPIGGLISGAIELRQQLFNAIMGGKPGPSEMAQLRDEMMQQFATISDEISEMDVKFGELSDQINESTNEIIASVSTALDDFAAKEDLKKFMLSTEGNFSYNQYRNYIYGDITDNSRSNTAYYALLMDAIASGASDNVVKHYYDELYESITAGYDVYYDYIVGDGIGKSIVQSYYSVVSKRPDLLAEQGMSPEMAAIAFAYDLYETQLAVDRVLLTCNNYQYIQMLLSGEDNYVCGNEMVTKASIESDMCVNTILRREEEIRLQFAADLAYIFKTNQSVVIGKDGRMYTLRTDEENGMMYAKVLDGQTVYMNRLPVAVCEQFDLRADGFVYSVGKLTDQSGILRVDDIGKNATVTLQYKYENTNGDIAYKTINTLLLADGAQTEFCGGSGTPADPYLIATAKQFASIGKGLDKSYRLVEEIDFAGEEPLTPFGYRETDNGTPKYDAFTGILDGNGYAVKNLTIKSSTKAGLFGQIGEDGVVKDLTLESVKVVAQVTEAKDPSNRFYVGAFAAQNDGWIKNCSINNTSSIEINVTNSKYDRHIYVYAGGIAGYNSGSIFGCFVDGSTVCLDSTHDFEGSKTGSNLHKGYAGGITGYNFGYVGYSVVYNESKVTATVTSKLSPMDTVNPYIDAFAGGIVGRMGESVSLSTVMHVFSDATAEAKGEVDVYDSGWGEHYGNVNDDSAAYIVGASENEVKKASVAEIKAALAPEKYTVAVSKVPDQTAGAGGFSAEGMTLTVNGEKASFAVLETYGFDSDNFLNVDSSVNREMTALVAVTVGGKQELFAIPVEYTVGPDFVERISGKAIQTVYKKGETVTGEDLLLYLYYACGAVVDTTAEIAEIVNAATATKEYGAASVEVRYQEHTAIVDIQVECGHRSNTDYSDTTVYEKLPVGAEDGSVIATCKNGGYDVYRCKECGVLAKTNYTLPKAVHTIEREVVKAATCQEEGSLGKVYCSSCGEVFYEGGVIPREPHKYVLDTSKSDYRDYHYCTNGDHREMHQYVFAETETEDGIVYILTCYEPGCCYSYTKDDSNIVTDASGRVPQVVVSDGFALQGGDLVTVYVQLVNNPGVDGAHFGVRYDSALELVGIPADGTLFEKSLVKDSAPVSCGYNFVWGDEATKTDDGNLLQLVFKAPADAKVGAEYRVSVVYDGFAEGIEEGGFGLDLEYLRDKGIITTDDQQQFLTRDGYVRIVEHLPGDINEDNVVDLMDALYICSFLVNKEREATKAQIQYGDLDLSGKLGLSDMLTILRTLNGGNGVNALYHKYKLALNKNGYGETEYKDVELYNDDHMYGTMTYADAGVTNPCRDGYKFLGWFKTLAGDDDTPIKLTDHITYEPAQKQQMLYARWQKNSVSFDMNGATSAQISAETYTEGGNNKISLPTPVESYRIVFLDKATDTYAEGTLSRSFAGWECGGKTYAAGETIDLSVEGLGTLTLKAKWNNDWTLSSSGLTKLGYRNDITWYFDATTLEPVGDISNISVLETIKARAVKNDKNDNRCDLYAVWNVPIEYKIVYDLDGGTFGEYYPLSAKYNETFSVSHPTRTGYTFAGWTITGMDNNDHIYKDSVGEEYTSKANTLKQNFGVSFQNLHATDGKTVTFTANWTAHTYTVEYIGNGATSGSTATSNHTYDVAKALTTNGFSRTGYTFLGWSTDAKATTATYSNKQSISNLTNAKEGKVTLYAVWQEHTYTIKYNANGGSGTMADTTPCNYKDSYTLRANAFTRTGYEFLGWNTDASATTPTYEDEQSVSKLTATKGGTVNLYAIWQEHTYTIKYNANGGSGTMANTTCNYKDSYTLRANAFTRTNYTFLGWSTNASATTPTYKDKQSVSKLTATKDGTVNLYAIWVKTSYSISKTGRNNNITLNNSELNEELYPGMNREALKANGYKTFKVTFQFKGRGVNLIAGHRPRLRVYSCTDVMLHDQTFSNFDGNMGSFKWKETTVTFSIDHTNSDGSFWFKWSTSGGSFNDGWCLDASTITVVAQK